MAIYEDKDFEKLVNLYEDINTTPKYNKPNILILIKKYITNLLKHVKNCSTV